MQTRKYPRTTHEAFSDSVEAQERRKTWEWFEGHQPARTGEADFWVYLTLAFAAGFVVHFIWG